MPSQIKLKRTFGVGLPDFPPVGTGVTDGELVYVYDTGDVGSGGTFKKLYIGDGINGVSSLPSPVGGQYYMERLPDDLTQEGVLAPRKVLSVNENSVIDRIQVGNGLSVSGVSTFYSDVRIEGDLTITDDLVFDEFEARQFVVTGVGTINEALSIGATLSVPNAFINAGIITDIVGTAATITTIDANAADIVTATIGSGIVTDIQVSGAATISGNFDLDSDLHVTGISTFVGITTQESTLFANQVNVSGVSTFYNDIQLHRTDGNPRDINFYDNSGVYQGAISQYANGGSGRLDINGKYLLRISSDGDVEITDGSYSSTKRAVFGDAGVELYSGVSTSSTKKFETTSVGATVFGNLESQTLNVTGVSTVVGVATFQDDVYIDGNLNVIGDIVYDEVSGRNLNISGVGTIANFNSGLGTITALHSPSAFINAGIITDIVGTAATITSIDTDDADILSAKITAGIITDIVGTAATITSLDTDAIDALAANIVAGIITDIVGTAATITTLDTDTIDALSARITAGIITNIVGTAATITTIDANAADIVTATIGSGIVTDIQVSGASTVTGIATFQNDVFIGGNLNIIGDVVYDEVTGRNLNITGVATIENLNAGVATITTLHSTDLNLNAGVITSITGTYATITNLVGTAATIDTLDIPVNLDVDGHTELDNANVSGIITVSSLSVSDNFDVYDLEAEFHNDVHIQGNLSVAGTFTNINQFDLFVESKDIVLGVTTNSSNEDISNDDTANHGGIAIASTEGNPLVSLKSTGINTLPDTYKQLMWLKAGTFGVGTTDAFLFNYAVGVGSTNVPNQAYMAVGNHVFYKNVFQSENLDVLNADILDAKITAGIITDIVGTAATITSVDAEALDALNAVVSGILTGTTFDSETAIIDNLQVTGTTTTGQLNVTGVSTFQSHVHLGDDDELRIGDSNDLKIFHNGSHSIIRDEGTGVLFLQGDADVRITDVGGNEVYGQFNKNSSVDLYFDNSKKFETTTDGIDVTGHTETDTLNVSGLSTYAGIATFQSDIFVGGNLNVAGDIVYDEVVGRNIFISGVGTFANIEIGTASTNTINSLTGALTLDSEIGNNVAINTHTNVVGFLSASDGIYYDLGDFNGPNGIAYFDSSGLLVSSGATTASISTSNYLVTTDASGIPVWTNVFDGGSF